MFSFMTGSMVIKIVIVAVAALVGIASYTVLKQPQDNPIEQASEQVIKYEIGVDLDLSPTSKEK